MSRPLDADNASAISATVTAPRWFVEMGFATPVRITSGPAITWADGGGAYAAADIDVRLNAQPSISLFNDAAQYGALFLLESAAGLSIKIWKAYEMAGATSSLAGHTVPVLMFEGEMGETSIADRVTVRCRQSAPVFSPRRYISPPAFNHLPQAGTVIEMPQQKITLE